MALLKRVPGIVGLLCLLLNTLIVHAQSVNTSYVVTGTIQDSTTRQPVAYATVGLLDTTGQLIVSGYARENGTFTLNVDNGGAYSVEISFVGYTTRTFKIEIEKSEFKKDLGILLLQETQSVLQEVQVTAKKRLVDQKPGMLVYNAENDLNNKGGTAADVLRKAPVLNVDAQGNVSMRGSKNLKILVNGKYSGQMARSAADALNMMPASMIKSVEIITTPSARYDAEGAAGVINIITKKGRNEFTGTIEAGASNLEQVLNPRLTFSNEKWNISLTGHLHRLRRKTGEVLNRTSFDSTGSTQLQQDILKDNTAPHGSADLAVDYMLNESSEISLGINSWLGSWPENSRNASLVLDTHGAVAEQYQQAINSRGKYLGADFSIGYTKKFKKEGQELNLLAQHSPSRDLSDYDAAQTGANKELLYRETNNSKTSNREWTFQADYTQPLNKKGSLLLESGAKLILRNVKNNYDVYASDAVQANDLVFQSERSDDFHYKQDVVAVYSLLKITLKHGWYVEAGVRGESTSIRGNFKIAANGFENSFFNLVPTATINRKLNDNNTIGLSYTKRLTRPYIWDLNPNANASDPKNIETGNPHLQPEIAHQAELSYSYNAGQTFFVNAAVYWKQTDNSIVDYVQTDAQGISYSSKQNLAGNKQYGLNVAVTANLSARWTMNGNVNVSYDDFTSRALTIAQKGWGADMNINSTYKLPHNYTIQVFGEYTARSVTLLGSEGRFYYYSFAGKKEIKKARMAVTLAAVNPFGAYVTQVERMQRPMFTSVTDNRYYNRSFKLTVNWEFGGKKSETKTRKKIENDDIKTQGKG
ncbi:MAG: TonB-dependent receptor [Chitinophagaceae bacterium]